MTTRSASVGAWGVGFGVALVACIQLSGCATVGPVGPVGDAMMITEAEIDSAHVSTAYDVIHKLRPQFLTTRGKLSLDPTVPAAYPRIYVDEQFYGDASTLYGILTGSIESIRYYTASTAQQKYGHDNAAGVIAITTKH